MRIIVSRKKKERERKKSSLHIDDRDNRDRKRRPQRFYTSLRTYWSLNHDGAYERIMCIWGRLREIEDRKYSLFICPSIIIFIIIIMNNAVQQQQEEEEEQQQ